MNWKEGTQRHLLLIIPVIWLFWGLALASMVDDSITMDEQNHIGRGIAFVKTADPRLSFEHPPLINSLSALPLLTMPQLDVPLDHSSWQKQPADIYWYIFADQLLWQRGNDVQKLTFLARVPIVLLTLLLSMVAYRLARAVWKRPFTLIAIPLILFDPNIMAHGRYSTTDLGGTLFITLATLLLWRLWQCESWSWPRWGWAAVGLGLAFSSKLLALAFVPIWGVMALLPLGSSTAPRRLRAFLTAGVASIAIVWALFGFEWGSFFFQSPQLQPLNALSGPMPTFWGGVEQITLLTSEGRIAYLNGNFQMGGFRSYFPIAFAIKTPIVTLLFFAAAALLLLWKQETRRTAVFLLIPITAYMLISMQSGLNIGYRHLLPMLPFVYVLIVGIGDWGLGIKDWGLGTGDWGLGIGSQFTIHNSQFTILLATLALIFVNLSIFPHYLSFFNSFVGGPTSGGDWLLDSNIDWGQDAIRLQKWMDENGVESVKLGWFGTADPLVYGVPNEPLPGFPRAEYLGQWTTPPFDPVAPEAGVYAISVSSLYALPLPDSTAYAWFRQREPDARVGYSIWIYRVSE